MKSFTISEAFSFGWSKYKEHWKFLVPLSIGLAILYVLVGWTSQPDSGLGIVQFIGTLVEMYLAMGIVHIGLRMYRNESVSLQDLFIKKDWFDMFWKYIAASIVVGIATLVGLILLIIPGIVWWVWFMFSQYFVVDKRVGPIEAMKMSKKIVKGEWWSLLGFVVMIILANILGAIVLGVGLLVSIPVTMLATVYVYKKLSEKKLDLRSPSGMTEKEISEQAVPVA